MVAERRCKHCEFRLPTPEELAEQLRSEVRFLGNRAEDGVAGAVWLAYAAREMERVALMLTEACAACSHALVPRLSELEVRRA